MKHAFRSIVALLVVAIMLFAFGCKQNEEPKTSGAPDTTGAPVNTETPGGNPEDDMLKFTYDSWPVMIDPGVGSQLSDSISFSNMYDSLVFPNIDGTVEPLIAKNWEANADATAYTFYLNDNVYFHSGNKLTAGDVKFSMDRLLTIGEGFAYLFAGLVSSVDAVDDTTVTFNLSRPSGTFAAMIVRLYILEEDVVMANLDMSVDTYGEFGDYGKNYLLTHDAGSGPYMVYELRAEEHFIMQRYDGYWRGWDENPDAPAFVKMLPSIATTTARTMIARGELDLTYTGTEEMNASLQEIEGVKIVRALAGANFNICLNTKKAPTDDIHVRKAMAYAFDYATIANSIYPGSVKATGPILRGLTACALTDEENPYYTDLDKAKAELEQSPYYDDLISGKMKLELTWCTEGGESQEKTALLVQANMAAIGITVEITGSPFATMISNAATIETTPNASFVQYATSYMDGGGFLRSRYHTSSNGSWEQMEWLQDPVLDAMIDEAVTIADQDLRNAKYKEISLYLMDVCPTIWMIDLASTFAYRSNFVTHYPLAAMFEAGQDFIYTTGYQAYFREFKTAK